MQESLVRLLRGLREDTFFLILFAGLVLLSVLMPGRIASYPSLVDWPTIAALTGLLLLTKGLEVSGGLQRLGHRLVGWMATERAAALVAAVQQLAKRHASDADAYAAAVTEFYAGHAALVAQTLLMPTETASVYCAEQAGQLLGEKGGFAALDAWGQPAYATWLAEWALGEGVAA